MSHGRVPLSEAEFQLFRVLLEETTGVALSEIAVSLPPSNSACPPSDCTKVRIEAAVICAGTATFRDICGAFPRKFTFNPGSSASNWSTPALVTLV